MVIAADLELFAGQLEDILLSGATPISNIKPSDWVELNVIMGQPFPGPYRYSRTPYCREIVDRLAADDDARWIAIMKGLQIGLSSGVIIPGMGWIIKEAPGNTYFTVGHSDLIDKSFEKLDIMIDNAGLRKYIKPQVVRNRANKSGDTNKKKDFSGGFINITTPNNHKEWRDVSLKYGFVDDFEAAIASSKQSGNTRKLIEGRFAAYADTHKIFYISTPEVKATSNIEPAYLLGDQRKYLVPCPCCEQFIEWVWTIEEEGRTGGITWKLNEANELIRESVGYTCQKCGGFFDDKNKHEMLNAGYWQPSARPSQPGYYSYHISSLYAPLGMYDWAHYVQNYLEANPIGQPRKEDLHRIFVNTCLGETYEAAADSPKANSIQKNCRNYDIGTIPEKLSMADGNGRIVLLTCAADMNGKEEDCRLDYEIVAWAENGASYSVVHGSLGTFIPRENTLKTKVDREKWTYDPNKERSVWPLLDAIVQRVYTTDTGRQVPVAFAGLDCGHFANGYAYPYLERTNSPMQGLKGDKENRYTRYGIDVPMAKPAAERKDLWILQVGLLKDKLSDYMGLRWDQENDDGQPSNFMNYPQPGKYVCPVKEAYYTLHQLAYEGDSLYSFPGYFEHFESEHRTVVNNAEGNLDSFRWTKKGSNVMNHFWDVRIYNIALREVLVLMFRKETGQKDFMWKDYVALVLKNIE